MFVLLLHCHSGSALRGLLLHRRRHTGDNDFRDHLQGELGISQEAKGWREIFANAPRRVIHLDQGTPFWEGVIGSVEDLIKQLCANGEHHVSRAKGAPNRGMLSRQLPTVLGVRVGKVERAKQHRVPHLRSELFGDLDQFCLRL